MIAPSARRGLAGAVLLDFAVSPLFAWDAFSAALAAELDAGTTAISAVFSVALAGFTAGVLLGGRLADRRAPRRLADIAGGGIVAGLVVTGLAPGVLVLVLGFGVLLGAASGLGYATAVRVAATVAAGRGTAVALVVSAYAAGAAVLAPIADLLLAQLGRAGAFAAIAVGIASMLGVARALLPAEQPVPPPASGERAPAVARGLTVRLWAMFALGSAPALVAFAHAGAFAGGPQWTVAAVAALNLGNFAGRLAAGPAADRFGRARALHLVAAAALASCAALALPAGSWVALPALLVLGTQYGALSVLTPVLTGDAVPAQRFGATYGRVFSGWGLVGLLGPVAAAALGSATDFRLVAAVLAGMGLAAWCATAGALRAARGC